MNETFLLYFEPQNIEQGIMNVEGKHPSLLAFLPPRMCNFSALYGLCEWFDIGLSGLEL